MTRRALLVLFFALGCARDERPRCSECGMYADVAPAFACRATDAAGRTLVFDAPRCLFRHRIGPDGRGMHAIRVTEHYSHELVAAESVVFVMASDVTGPMGRDLVPVAREHAAQFIADHGGKLVNFSDIDATTLGSLDR